MEKNKYWYVLFLVLLSGCFSWNSKESNLKLSINWEAIFDSNVERKLDPSIEKIILRLENVDSGYVYSEKEIIRESFDSSVESLVIDNLEPGGYKIEIIAMQGVYTLLRNVSEIKIEKGDNSYKIKLDKIVYVGDNSYYINSPVLELNVVPEGIKEIRSGVLGQVLTSWSSLTESNKVNVGLVQGNKTLIVELRDENKNVFKTKLELRLDSIPPEGNFTINNNETTVRYSEVIIFSHVLGADYMRFAISKDEIANAEWSEYRASEVIRLENEGLNTVFGEYRDIAGNIHEVQKNISYNPDLIVSISSIVDVSVAQYSILPEFVTATMSDGSYKSFELDWGNTTTSTKGTFDLRVSIGGGIKPIRLIVY